MNRKYAFWLLSFLTLIADQATKFWATARLKPVGMIEVIPGYVRFSYALNRGVAFSLFADVQFNIKWVLAAISGLAAMMVVHYLARTPFAQRLMCWSLSLLLAGILGNLIDRIRLGEVVDFIELHWRDQFTWPTFNIADSAICIGAVLLALELLKEERAGHAKPVAAAANPNPAPEEASSAE
ncbi:MAG: signal peptidase II [Acidobacteria bacterium]|nr:signal peptidase II [Acidobacteriota bacterium]MBI3423222.1 signal peptidase II [Acidobacteriota bacterium]